MLDRDTKEAVQDLRYLLNRGFPRSSAVEFVSDHYQLELEKRHLLARCVFSEDEIGDHRNRLLDPSESEGRELGIDGYNVLITVESILNGESVVKCDDGFVRDLQAIFGKYKMTDSSESALVEILREVRDMEFGNVTLLFDEQVSKSGELAGLTRLHMEKMGIEGNARTAVGVDAKVWDFDVSASSDRVIIERSSRVLDIPAEFLNGEEGNLVNLEKV